MEQIAPFKLTKIANHIKDTSYDTLQRLPLKDGDASVWKDVINKLMPITDRIIVEPGHPCPLGINSLDDALSLDQSNGPVSIEQPIDLTASSLATRDTGSLGKNDPATTGYEALDEVVELQLLTEEEKAAIEQAITTSKDKPSLEAKIRPIAERLVKTSLQAKQGKYNGPLYMAVECCDLVELSCDDALLNV